MGRFAQNRFVHNAGSAFVYNSFSFASDIPFELMRRNLANEYGGRNVRRMSRDVLGVLHRQVARGVAEGA